MIILHIRFISLASIFSTLFLINNAWASCSGLTGEDLKECQKEEGQVMKDRLEFWDAAEYWKENYKCPKLKNKAKEKCMRESLSKDEANQLDSYRKNKKHVRINGVIKEVIIGTGE
ncbi:MAG: hypothetical protein J0M25_13020 [Flavobacteriales bacterium]|nr:hypothetical protein [Flavobacteriales bacterium]